MLTDNLAENAGFGPPDRSYLKLRVPHHVEPNQVEVPLNTLVS